MNVPHTPATLDDTDRAIINALQGEFPICENPFAAAAAPLGLSEAQLIARLEQLLANGTLTRFGPMFQIERMGGAFCLAAMAVPEDRYDEVTKTVNAFDEVAHNYRREHALNMWFVLATEAAAGVEGAAHAIEAATGLPVYLFPKEREFFVEMRLRA
ncbi:MAG TPA: AsnC family transcriptional regulator [Methyloversatilis sp.]